MHISSLLERHNLWTFTLLLCWNVAVSGNTSAKWKANGAWHDAYPSWQHWRKMLQTLLLSKDLQAWSFLSVSVWFLEPPFPTPLQCSFFGKIPTGHLTPWFKNLLAIWGFELAIERQYLSIGHKHIHATYLMKGKITQKQESLASW